MAPAGARRRGAGARRRQERQEVPGSARRCQEAPGRARIAQPVLIPRTLYAQVAVAPPAKQNHVVATKMLAVSPLNAFHLTSRTGVRPTPTHSYLGVQTSQSLAIVVELIALRPEVKTS